MANTTKLSKEDRKKAKRTARKMLSVYQQLYDGVTDFSQEVATL